MQITNDFIRKLGGLATTVITRQWMKTLDYQVKYYTAGVDPASPDFRGPAIFVFWHEYIPLPFYLRGHCRVSMLLSRHHDAEWLSQAARHMGFGTVRGSTSRGGVAALRELIRAGKTVNLAITPDGPRGPRRKLATGCIYASSRLGVPLVPIGLGYDRPWRSRRSWDRFAVPRPYSRARVIAGPPIQIPAHLQRAGFEHYRERVERILDFLTVRAEKWAESGNYVVGQRRMYRRGAGGMHRPAVEKHS